MTDPSESPSPSEAAAQTGDLPRPPALRLSPQTALFLDFDGTLVEIADHPDEVIVPADLGAMLARLSSELDGRLAIVSGRSLAALETMLGPIDVAMAGSHGGEFRPAGSREVHPLADPLEDSVVERLSRFASDNGGLLVEPKPYSVAVHYRRHPEALEGLLACATAIAESDGLKLKHGKQVIELVMPGSDKGSAVARFMQSDLFAGTEPMFLGDDVTDEDAFKEMARFAGCGVLVGPLRETAARWRLAGVDAVHDWLAEALATGASPASTHTDPETTPSNSRTEAGHNQ